MKLKLKNLWTLIPLVLLVGCGGEKEPEEPEVAFDLEADLAKFYADNAETYQFKTLKDLPDNLKWESGADQKEFGSPNAKKGGTYNFYVNDFPRTLRLVGPGTGAFRRYKLDYNGGPGGMGLTSRHPNTLEHFPCLAREWAYGDDGKTVFFRLDPEARYSDGEPVKADDYLFMFYFMRSPHIKAPWYNDYFASKYTNVTKFDELTISVTFSEAKPDLLYRTSLRPIPQHFYKDFGPDFEKRYNFVFEPTTGPYEILPENMDKGRSVTLTKVKDWWLEGRKFYRYRYNVDNIHLEVVREPSKALELFKLGEIDAHKLDLPEYWHQKIPDDSPLVQNGYLHKITFYNQEPGPDWGLRLNTAKPPLDNKDVRIGLNHAMDWDLVIREVFYGDYIRMETAESGFGEFTPSDIKARRFDPTKAKEHFAKAGFSQMGPDGILRNSAGQRLSITVTTGYKRLENVLTVLQQAARKAGVELNLEILEQTAAWKKADEKKHQINFAALNRSAEMYPRYWEMYHSYHAYEEDGKTIKTNTNNDTQTAIPELDELIDKYRFSPDKEEMIELSHQISEMLYDHAAFIPGWRRPFYRVGVWRWMKYPEDTFDARTARDFEEMGVYWIDEDIKKETLEAMKSGKTFPPVIEEYTTWKE